MKKITEKIISGLSITIMCAPISLLSVSAPISAAETKSNNSCYETGEVQYAKETSQVCTGTSVTTINPSFEQNNVGIDKIGRFVKEDEVPGWNTTDSSGKIEFWSNGAQSGQNYIELNAYNNASIYQDVVVNGGETITFSFWHKARDIDDEAVKVVIGTPDPNAENNNSTEPVLNGDAIYSEEFSVDKGEGWVHHSGEVVLPKQSEPYPIRLAISSLGGLDKARGNFLDNVKFSSDAIYDSNLEIVETTPEQIAPIDKKFLVSSDFTHIVGDNATDVKNTFTLPQSFDVNEDSIKVSSYSGEISKELASSDYSVSITDGIVTVTLNDTPPLENLLTSFEISIDRNNLNAKVSDISAKSEFKSELASEIGAQSENSWLVDYESSPIIFNDVIINGSSKQVDIKVAPKNQDELINTLEISAYDSLTLSDADFTIDSVEGYDYNNPQIGSYNVSVTSSGVNKQLVTKQFVLVISAADIIINASSSAVDINTAPRSEDELTTSLNVSALDGDGNTATVKFSELDGYDFDKPQVGTYNITVSATGINGVTKTKQVTLSVTAADVVISGTDVSKDINDNPTSKEDLEKLFELSAIDGDGQSASYEIVSVGGYDYENPMVGSYTITVGATGINGSTVTNYFTLNITAEDVIVNGQNAVVDINDAPKSESELISNLQLSTVDGDGNSAEFSVSDIGDYDYSNSKVGEYYITVVSTGINGNEITASYTLTISAKDVIINGTDKNIDINDAPTNEDEIFSSLEISAIDGDMSTVSPKLTELDGYDYENPTVGIYNLSFSYTGINGNTVLKVVNLEISAADVIISGNDVEVDFNSRPKTNEDIIKLLEISAEDGDHSVADFEIESVGNYDYDNQEIGTYVISVASTGINGNKVSTQFFLTTTAGNVVIHSKDAKIDFKNAPKSNQEILDLLDVSATDINGEILEVKVADTNYNVEEVTSGTFKVTFSATGISGEEVTTTNTLTINPKEKSISIAATGLLKIWPILLLILPISVLGYIRKKIRK